MRRLYILTLISVTLSCSIFIKEQLDQLSTTTQRGELVPSEWLQLSRPSTTPSIDTRAADDTFLTFPEWYLVFSPEEQAHYFQTTTASSFPFWSHILQFWQSYQIVNDQIKDRFPTNTGYHFMIWVIGTSSSAEYFAKSWYETIIGRVTDTGISITDEDRFNAEYTKNYVEFIKVRPWYEYDFQHQLSELWSSSSWTGQYFLRKLERKYFLTSELIAKYAYGKLITIGTQQVYDQASVSTAVVLNDGRLLNLHRYDKFSEDAIQLTRLGFSFKEIAGNNTAILASCVIERERSLAIDSSKILLTQPICSDPAYKRVVYALPVAALSGMLTRLDSLHIRVEHVFDF